MIILKALNLGLAVEEKLLLLSLIAGTTIILKSKIIDCFYQSHTRRVVDTYPKPMMHIIGFNFKGWI